MKYWIIRKKGGWWTAYKLDKLPPLKWGYEARGPYKSIVACMVAANQSGGKEND